MSASMPARAPAGGGPHPAAFNCLFAAWLVALLATVTVLVVGEVLGQAPCHLCWFQRAFMFPLALLLGLACWRAETRIAPYGIALCLGGAGFALYHALMLAGVIAQPIVPCGAGPSCDGAEMLLAGVVPLPLLALAAFVAIGTLLAASLLVDRPSLETSR